jgi:hypothetical protein
MTFLAILTSLGQLFALLLYLHPIHVSVTEIEFDEKDRALEIIMRVFMDDLELTLRSSRNEPDLDILNGKDGRAIDQMAEEYLLKHFKISLDNKAQTLSYLGHEREAEAFIFYIEVRNVNPWQSIHIQNEIIMSTYDDQSNIVHVFKGEDVKSLRLTRNTPADKLTF